MTKKTNISDSDSKNNFISKGYNQLNPIESLREYIVIILTKSRCICYLQARNKPADGGGHVNQKNAAGQKATTAGQKGKLK